MGRISDEKRFERANVAVCWSTPRQQWLLCNVTDLQTGVAERAMFVEVFTQGFVDEEWVWRDSYYPADTIRRSFWSHQFAEDAMPRSVELADLEQDWPAPQLPESPQNLLAPQENEGGGLRRMWDRIMGAVLG